jgi:type VI secretion system protein ImpH
MKTPVPNRALRRWEGLLTSPEREASRQAACWDWYALLRLVQCAYPEYPRIGYALAADQEPLRLGQPTFFHHPSTTVASLARQGPREIPAGEPAAAASAPAPGGSKGALPAAWIYSYHFGLFGPYGPLPLHLTEFAHRRLRAHDAAFFGFCNVLVHRFLCFFFRAWAEGRKELTLDRPHSLPASHQAFARLDIAEHGEECWEFFLGAMIGCGLDSLRSRDRVPEEARLFYAGRLLQQTRNAEGLCAIIQHYFALPARILEFQPRTLPIPEAALWNLGAETFTGRLGWSTLVGASVLDYQSGFRIRLGPLSLGELEQFFPDTDGFGQLHDWVRFYCGKETDPNPAAGVESAWDLQLVLRGAEVPKLKLGKNSRLGLTTWLHSAPPQQDVEDLVLRPRLGAAPAPTPPVSEPTTLSPV